MDLTVICAPYDSGYFEKRAGRGPSHILGHGLIGRLTSMGHDVELCRLEPSSSLPTEIGGAFDLCRLASDSVKAISDQNRFPIVLSGNCNLALGTMAGLGLDGLAVIWLDAHGEFNTPETTRSGFLDGMGLAVATGRCWREIARTIPGFRPLEELSLALWGVRDLDPPEKKALAQSQVSLVRLDDLTQGDPARAVEDSLAVLASRAKGVYLHIDMDVFDLGPARASSLSGPGGLEPGIGLELIRLIKRTLPLRALGIASYDPLCDVRDLVLNAANQIIEAVLAD